MMKSTKGRRVCFQGKLSPVDHELAWQAGAVIGALVAAGKLDLAHMATAVRTAEDPEGEPAGPGEDPELITGGGALDLVVACLKQLEEEQGSAAMAAAWQATGMDILSFVPSVPPRPSPPRLLVQ